MTDIATFVAARLNEKEAAANAAAPDVATPGDTAAWTLVHTSEGEWAVYDHFGDSVAAAREWIENAEAVGRHIVRHDPARVLREVAAMRAVLEEHAAVPRGVGYTYDGDGYGDVSPACSACGKPDEYAQEWPCDTIKALVTIWADHPDFKPEWGLPDGQA